MNNKTTRRTYAVPEAELICLAPTEEIASNKPGWQPWFQQGDEWWALNKWGASPTGVSITAGYTWLDVLNEEKTEYEKNSELD